MGPFRDADAPFRGASNAYLTSCGFTEAQAMAVAACVRTSTSEAVEALRHDLARWHAYLALYLLAQIGIVLLAGLLMTDPTLPRPTAWDADWSGEALSAAPSSRFGTAARRLN